MRKSIFYLLLLLLVGTSCKFKVKDGLNWDQNLVAPILKSRIGLANAIQDTNFIQSNPDNSLTVVYRDTLVDIALSDYLTVPDTSFAAKITLDSIQLATDTLDQLITLGQIARSIRDQGDPIGQTIIDNHGNNLFFFPGVNDLESDDVVIDASQFFQEADLINGWIVVEIFNGLPVDITSVTFHLRNNGLLTDTLVRKTIAPIPSGTTKSDSASLAGKTVGSMMAGKLEDIDIASGFNVPIDTNDYIRMRIIVRDMQASSATAVFPAQRVINDRSWIRYSFDNGMKIKKLKSKSGQLRIDAISTLQDTITFDYLLPTAIRNGAPVNVTGRLVPDLLTGSAEAHITFDLIDYYIDMTLNGDSINLFPYRLFGDLLYSGRLSSMDLNDSIDLSYGLYDIIPSYIEGYLGTTTFNYKDTLDFSFFGSILGGTVDLSNPTVNLTMTNSIGVDGEMRVNQMQAFNSRTNQNVNLTGQLMSYPTEVRGPKLPNVGQTIVTPISINKNNSNINSFLSLLPDKIAFDMDVNVNKNGNPDLLDNFATDDSKIGAYLDIEIPLYGITDHLWLQDTLALNVGETTLPAAIDEGKLKFVGSNQFPFEAQAQVYFTDQSGQIFDSLFTSGSATLPAGRINQDGYVDTPGTAELIANFDQPRFMQLKQRGKNAILKFVLSTKPNGTPVKLYTTYGIDFTLVGDFKYRISQ